MESEIDMLMTILADSFPDGAGEAVEDLFDRLLIEKGKQCAKR